MYKLPRTQMLCASVYYPSALWPQRYDASQGAFLEVCSQHSALTILYATCWNLKWKLQPSAYLTKWRTPSSTRQKRYFETQACQSVYSFQLRWQIQKKEDVPHTLFYHHKIKNSVLLSVLILILTLTKNITENNMSTNCLRPDKTLCRLPLNTVCFVVWLTKRL